MKAFVLYAAAILGGFLLYRVSELWYGAEWIFGLLTVGWFGLFLFVWKQLKPGGAGVILVTAFTLIDISSIFFLQNLPTAICNLLIGLLLVPFFRRYPDVVLSSVGLVLLGILICIDTGSIATMWMLFIAAGALALIGFRLRFRWAKRCYTVLFAITVPVLLINYSLENAYLVVVMVLAGIAAVAAGSYKLAKQPLL